MDAIRDLWVRLRDGMQLTRKEVLILIVLGLFAGVFFFLWLLFNRNQDATGDLLFTLAIQFGWAVVGFIVLEVVMVRVREMAGNTDETGFEYKRFVHNVHDSSKRVRMLTTFTYLLSPEGSGIDPQLKYDFFVNLQTLVREHPKAKVQLLFLDPFSYAAYQREPAPGEDVHKRIKNNLIEVYKWLQDVRLAESKNVEVYVFDALPPFALLQTDSRIWMIFFKRGVAIKDSPRFECFVGTQLATYVDTAFNELWNDPATSRPLDQYMRVEVIVNTAAGSETAKVYFVKDERRFLKKAHTGRKNFYLLLNRILDKALLESIGKPDAKIRLKWRGSEREALSTQVISINSVEDTTVEMREEKYCGKFEFHTILRIEIDE